MASQLLQSVVDKFKQGYFFFENKYYELLDKINKYVPIYKVIDPIDKVIPSFALLISLIVCLVILFIFLSAPAALFSATISAIDVKGDPIEGVAINLFLDDKEQSLSTDSWGETSLDIPAEEVEVSASFSKKSYEAVAKTILLVAGETTTVTLTKVTAWLGPLERIIKVVDGSTNRLIKKKVTITYSCSGGVSAPIQQENSPGTAAEFTVMQSPNCPVLTATASADGYERKSKTIASAINQIILNPRTAETTGSVHVSVKNSDGTYASDVAVRLIDETTNSAVYSGSTSQAGTASFSSVDPGTYAVSVSAADDRKAQKTAIVVTAGEITRVTITLPELAAGKKILLQLIEQGTNKKVANATVFIYQDSVLINSKTSDAQGLVEEVVSDETATYLAVIRHYVENYITKIEPNLPLKDPADNEPIKVVLVRSKHDQPNPTAAKAFVLVSDEEAKPINDASVWLYDDRYPIIPLNHPAKKTNADGNAAFYNLPAGTYFARAKDSKTKAEGVSEKKAVAVGETLVLTVTVVIGEGLVEATVYDADSAQNEKIQGAEVEFIDVFDRNVLSACTTNVEGTCESGKIKADKLVYVKASKPGFISALSEREIDIVSKSKAKAEIGLKHESSFGPPKTIRAEFLYFCNDWQCKSKPAKIESAEQGAKTYFGRFEIILDKDADYSNIVQHIRVGLNNELALPADYGIKIAEVRGEWAPGSRAAVPSNCWNGNREDPFEDPADCSTSIDAKQVNVYYDAARGKLVLPVTLKFAIQPGLPDKTELRFYYRAKADAAGETVVTDEKLRIFQVNTAFCQDEGFAWSFSLHELDGSTVDLSLGPDAPPYDLLLNAEYGLSYWIYNCSGKDQQASLTAENLEPVHVISFKQHEDDFGPINAFPSPTIDFQNDTELSSEQLGKVLQLYTKYDTGGTPTELLFALDVGQQVEGSTATLKFTVSSNLRLIAKGLPNMLSDVGTPQLNGVVSDAVNQELLIENAYVVVKIPQLDQTIEADNGGYTNEAGRFSFTNLPNLTGVESVTIEARKAGYETLQISIPVGHSSVIVSPDYECISFKSVEGEDTEAVSVERSKRTEASFLVETTECAENLEVMLETELLLLDGTIALNDDRDAQFSLDVTDDKTVSVKAQKNQANSDFGLGIGEYYVHLFARFRSDQGGFKGPLQKLRVFVSDDRVGVDPEYCFRLADPADPDNTEKMKSSFDIAAGLDSGLIYNTCFAFIEDLMSPSIQKVHVHAANEEIFGLRYGLPPLSPPQEKTKWRNLNAVPLASGDALTLSVSDGGGFVTLQWVDVFMTDEKHFGEARHKLWAHYFRGENDWLNITDMLPYTAAGKAGTKKGAEGRLKSPFEVIDNEGWVDTDTYHPEGARYDTDISKDPMWQAQHNVCNRNIKDVQVAFGTCSVPGYFEGKAVQPYRVATTADKIKLEANVKEDGGEVTAGSKGKTTKVSQIKWHYTNTDPNHNGVIDFDVINTALAGETYALIEVEDSVVGSGIISEELPFDWVLAETGIKEWTESINQLDTAQTIGPGGMLGISVDSDADPKFKHYSHSDDLNLASLLADLAADPVVLDAIIVLSTTEIEDEVLVIKYYVDGQWYESPALDLDVEAEGPDPEDISLTFNLARPTPIEAIALVNISDSLANPLDIVIDGVNPVAYKKEVVELHEITGMSKIEAGETQATFEITPVLFPTADSAYNRVEYEIYDSGENEEKVTIYFSDTKTSATERRPGDSQKLGVIAITSSLEEVKKTEKELFHIRLVGVEQTECLGYGGLSGQTGYIAKPRVLLNWDWDTIGIDACDVDNMDYIYCDPVQFSIMLVKRLERIKQLADEDITDPDNIEEIQRLSWFKTYLIEDSFSDDFRSDFVNYYRDRTFDAPLRVLHEKDSFWDEYFKSAEKMHFRSIMSDGSEVDPAQIEAGLHDVFLSFYFLEDQYDFFYESPELGLTAEITVILTKLSDPAIPSPFYHLPFNGDVGEEIGGVYHREGYGLHFNNTTEPIVLSASAVQSAFVATTSDSGARPAEPIETEKVSDLRSINFSNRGMVLEIATDLSSIRFAPSFATPVLMALLPEPDGKVEAYYYLTDPTGKKITSPVQDYMNFWTGCGSSMGNVPFDCLDYYGKKLPFRWQDSKASSGTCAIGQEPDSYGFSFSNGQPTEQLYYESIFYVPFDEIVNLHPACRNNSQFYSSTDSTTGGSLVSLAKQESAKSLYSVQEVLNLVDAGYVCVTADIDSIKFWWNPQHLLSDLALTKEGIAQAMGKDWETELTCNVTIGQ